MTFAFEIEEMKDRRRRKSPCLFDNQGTRSKSGTRGRNKWGTKRMQSSFGVTNLTWSWQGPLYSSPLKVACMYIVHCWTKGHIRRVARRQGYINDCSVSLHCKQVLCVQLYRRGAAYFDIVLTAPMLTRRTVEHKGGSMKSLLWPGNLT